VSEYDAINTLLKSQSFQGRCENPDAGISRNMAEYHGMCRNITEYAGISRNMPEYHGIWLNITEYPRHFPGIYRNITIFFDGSHATVYKHGRPTTYFITKVMDLSHFDGK
jgi:hypothetical protein